MERTALEPCVLLGLRVQGHRGTSLIRNSRTPQDHHRPQGVVLLLGHKGGAVSYERGTPEQRGVFFSCGHTASDLAVATLSQH